METSARTFHRLGWANSNPDVSKSCGRWKVLERHGNVRKDFPSSWMGNFKPRRFQVLRTLESPGKKTWKRPQGLSIVLDGQLQTQTFPSPADVGKSRKKDMETSARTFHRLGWATSSPDVSKSCGRWKVLERHGNPVETGQAVRRTFHRLV
jgi:hypothetical protein